MPPRRSLISCLCKLLVFCMVIQASRAIRLDTPPDFIPKSEKDTFETSWSLSPGDPQSFDLDIQCDVVTSSSRLIAGVASGASPKFPEVPPVIWFQVVEGESVKCFLQAVDAEDGTTVLAKSNVFQAYPKGTIIGTTKIFTSTTSRTPVFTPPIVTFTTTDTPTTSDSTTKITLTTETDKPSSRTTSSSAIPTAEPTSNLTTSSPFSSSTSKAPLPTTTKQSQPTTPASFSKKNLTGPIAGAIIGACAFVACLFLAFILHRRRRRRNHLIATPLVYEQGYRQPLNKDGKLAEVLSEKSRTQTQRAQLRIEVESNPFDDPPSATPVLRTGMASMASARTVQEQVQHLSQRILLLEVQQRELEYSEALVPPDYTSAAH